jgi:hypothetical protein
MKASITLLVASAVVLAAAAASCLSAGGIEHGRDAQPRLSTGARLGPGGRALRRRGRERRRPAVRALRPGVICSD